MKQTKRIMLGICCCALLIISWLVALSAKSAEEKQRELIEQAQTYLDDKVYVLAAQSLEEAAQYEEAGTLEAEELLKQTYLQLIDQRGYRKKYTELLDKQMSRKDAKPEVFEEAALYYLSVRKEETAFDVFRDGIEKTQSDTLIRLYEQNRYQYTLGRTTYEDVTTALNGAIQVKQDGRWGLAAADGELVIPCEYDCVSTYSDGSVVVQKDNEIFTVNTDNNRTALLHETVLGFGNLSENRLSFQKKDGWVLANGSFKMLETVYEELGTYANGFAAAKLDGKWGLLDRSGDWEIEPEYDEIICDELGRCYAQGAIFVRKKDRVLLLVDGEEVGKTYEDAKPFNDGWAAVKKDGKWGFIDSDGVMQIEPQFEDALSFGQHLAAVKTGGRWGFVSRYGNVVIEAEFLNAKSFCNGSAPVLGENGWQFITLVEYEEDAGL